MNDNFLNELKGYFKKVVLGLIGFVVTFFLITSIFAAVLTYVDLPDSAVTVMSMATIAISNIVGAFIASKLNGKFGAIIGAVFGSLTFLVITIISLAISKDSVTIIQLSTQERKGHRKTPQDLGSAHLSAFTLLRWFAISTGVIGAEPLKPPSWSEYSCGGSACLENTSVAGRSSYTFFCPSKFLFIVPSSFVPTAL